MKGIHGKILIVDLSQKTTLVEDVPETVYQDYLGGYGLGAWYLYHHIPVDCDPLGPDNILGFTPGLLTGTGAPFTGRYMVCAKSPLTGKGKRTKGSDSKGGWGNANSGGYFGPAIKKSGFDAIFFKGSADQPVYLLIDDQKIVLEDADFLWGNDTVETEEILIEKHGKLSHVASIGVAGENLSLISGIANDKGRMAARSGLGAVMGSKKLKAICLVANKPPVYADKPRMLGYTKEYVTRMVGYKNNKVLNKVVQNFDFFAPVMRMAKMGLTSAPGSMLPRIMGAAYGGAALGTPMSTIISAQTADSPIKNYAGTHEDFPFKNAMHLRVKNLEPYNKKQYGCHSCPLQCGYILEYDKLPYKNKETHRPEYETLCSFGSLILNDDLDAILKVNEYLNRAGMDSISAGVLVGYVMEAVEKGIFKQEDFKCEAYPEGFLPKFGESTHLLTLLDLIVHREGLGDKLADGIYEAKIHFPQTEDFVMAANGSAMGMHDLRAGQSWGQSYVADPTPGRHTSGNYDLGVMGMPDFCPEMKPLLPHPESPYQKGKVSAHVIKMHQVMESVGLCMFVYFFGEYHLPEVIESVTGVKMSVEDILKAGGRIQTTRQMFNAREGAIRHELPQRAVGSPPLKKGSAAGISVDIETMVQGYYEGMGYGEDGVPSEETLRSYGLEAMIPDLQICTGAPKRFVNEYLMSDDSVKKGQKHRPSMGG